MRATQAVLGLMLIGALAGCQRTSMGDFGGRETVAPVQAQPVPAVQSGQLAAPTGDPSQFPAPPVTATADPALPQDGTQVAAASPAAAAALDVKKEAMVGNWRVQAAGSSCDMFLTLTNLGSGSRGGTRGCAGELTAMGSWEVSGKQVVLKDRDGNPIARLYKSAESRFDGSTNSGQSVSLSR
ncbi:protease inhibitor Inh/omp19 family protein [Ensifer soli]|uniref:protease inhibitor Inh/omp19 family protein n=1 Tax=Ciceribacter sp. sgz301302 TaxID=3342379 RepID=UPI0035BA6C91